MKTIKVYFIISILLFLFSCRDWNNPFDEAATTQTINVKVVGIPADYAQGSDVNYVVTAQTAGKKDVLKTLTITGTGIDPKYSLSYPAEMTVSTDTVKVAIPSNTPAGTAVELTFEATTDKGTSAVANQSFTVVSGVQTYEGLTLTYRSTDFWQANILDATTGTALQGDDDKSKFDVVFGYNGASTALYTLASPNSSWLASAWFQTSWSATGQNNTQINKLDNFDFAGATLDQLNAISVTSPGDGAKNNVQVGDNYGFITARGQKGVINIKSLGAKKSTEITKSITVDVKVTPLAATAK